MDIETINAISIIVGLTVVFVGFVYLSKSLFGYNSYNNLLLGIVSVFFVLSIAAGVFGLFKDAAWRIGSGFNIASVIVYALCVVCFFVKRVAKSKTLLSIHVEREIKGQKKFNNQNKTSNNPFVKHNSKTSSSNNVNASNIANKSNATTPSNIPNFLKNPKNKTSTETQITVPVLKDINEEIQNFEEINIDHNYTFVSNLEPQNVFFDTNINTSSNHRKSHVAHFTHKSTTISENVQKPHISKEQTHKHNVVLESFNYKENHFENEPIEYRQFMCLDETESDYVESDSLIFANAESSSYDEIAIAVDNVVYATLATEYADAVVSNSVYTDTLDSNKEYADAVISSTNYFKNVARPIGSSEKVLSTQELLGNFEYVEKNKTDKNIVFQTKPKVEYNSLSIDYNSVSISDTLDENETEVEIVDINMIKAKNVSYIDKDVENKTYFRDYNFEKPESSPINLETVNKATIYNKTTKIQLNSLKHTIQDIEQILNDFSVQTKQNK